MKIIYDSFKIYSAFAGTVAKDTSSGKYWEGESTTPIGIVSIYAQKDDRQHRTYTSLRFVHKSRLHIKTIYKLFSDRGLAIVSHRFAKSIISK